MIVFDLECRTQGHRFEGWFGSSDDFAAQQQRGLISCPQCGDVDVLKAPMAPRVARKGNQSIAPTTPRAPSQTAMSAALPAEAIKMMHALASMQAEALKESRWVGGEFAEQSRAMYYGERAAETIHGRATLEEARALLEEGVTVAPLLFPIAPPGETN